MLTLPISMPRFNSIIFFIKIALKLSYFCKKMQNFRAMGAPPPDPKTALPLRIPGYARGNRLLENGSTENSSTGKWQNSLSAILKVTNAIFKRLLFLAYLTCGERVCLGVVGYSVSSESNIKGPASRKRVNKKNSNS